MTRHAIIDLQSEKWIMWGNEKIQLQIEKKINLARFSK